VTKKDQDKNAARSGTGSPGRPSGHVRRDWGAVLHVARRLANRDFPDGRHNRPVLRVLVRPRAMDSTA
jgi:hypothetical protein